jgi:hypothetical protein
VKRDWLKKSLLALNLEIIANESWSETQIQEWSLGLADPSRINAGTEQRTAGL